MTSAGHSYGEGSALRIIFIRDKIIDQHMLFSSTMSSKKNFQRTRLAPTPSGYLHLGNVASFVLTVGLARNHGAKILLRIDDMDRERVRPEYLQDIFDTLKFLDIPWDEGPCDVDEFTTSYSQIHRLDLYRAAWNELAGSGLLFGCSCSRKQFTLEPGGSVYPGNCLNEQIPLDRHGISWRLKAEAGIPVVLHDLNSAPVHFTLPSSVQYIQVRKKDGHPSYQLSSILDDDHFGVDLIVRGHDLFDSTLAQLHMSSLLKGNAFGNSVFFHHPLLMGTNGQKLSKSGGSTSINHLRKIGAEPADVFSLIAGTLGRSGKFQTWEELFILLWDTDLHWPTHIH